MAALAAGRQALRCVQALRYRKGVSRLGFPSASQLARAEASAKFFPRAGHVRRRADSIDVAPPRVGRTERTSPLNFRRDICIPIAMSPHERSCMSTPQAKLLIVDDDELNRDGLARRLQKHDYEVAVAKSGREGIGLLGDRTFDLVLLDIMMPGMNGLEVLKFLRRVDSLIDLPIIMVTAKGESNDVIEALELGANDYVTKPLDVPVVFARIRTQLALRQAVAQVKKLEGELEAHNRQLRTAATELEAANERHGRDMEAAARVQRAFLPRLPREVRGARFA